MKLFVTFIGGRTEKLNFPSFEAARLWLTEHAKEIAAVSEVVG